MDGIGSAPAMPPAQPLAFDPADLAEAAQLNRRLAKAPRFRVRNRVTPRLLQALLRVSQIGGDRRLRRRGLSVEQRRVGSGDRVPVRILRPAGPLRGVVLDIHGGGWVIGNARMDDAANAALVEGCGVAVVSVDYRLATGTPIAGLMDDCLAAARWLLAAPEFAGLPVFVVGESAGGHLAAATLLRLKQSPALLARIAGAVLHYGVYDLSGTESVRRAGAETLVLDGPGMLTGLRKLTPGLSDTARRQPPLSPLHGDLRGLPPALLLVGERDPLLDDTLQLAARWAATGDVTLHRIPEAPHGFIHFPTRMAARVFDCTHEWIRTRIAAVAQVQ